MRKTIVATPDPDEPKYELVKVTPELAEKWLAQNTHNRNLRENAVIAYARDMENGAWRENGESIKFAADGTLLDGQHRLQAVALSGVTLRMLVVSGLANASQETMDDGRKRTLADALKLRRESNAVVLAALLRRGLMWTHGYYRNTGAYSPTNTECLNFLERHPEVRDSATAATSLRRPTKLPASVLGLTHWLFVRIDAADTQWFFDHLASGVDLPQYHPVWALRRRADLADRDTGRVPEDMLLACVIKAWNAYRAGEQIKILSFKPGGASPEKFPMPK